MFGFGIILRKENKMLRKIIFDSNMKNADVMFGFRKI